MAKYKDDLRETYQMLDCTLETLLPRDSVVRLIRKALDSLDFGEFDALYVNDDAGRTALDPRSLAGVWIYGMLRGVTSSVRLAALCAMDIEFRWLMCGQFVEKSTLCDFRKHRKEPLAALGAQVLGALGAEGLLPGENLGVDGSIVRAASSRHAVKSRRRLNAARQRLEDLLREKLSQPDAEPMAREIESLAARRRRIDRALEAMDARGLDKDADRINTTEPDAGVKRQKDGSFAPGHNAQAVSDLDTGVVVFAEIVEAGGDGGQLQPQIDNALETLEALRARGVLDTAAPDAIAAGADGAYHDTRQLEAMEGEGIACFVPDSRAANRLPPGVSPEYAADKFRFDAASGTMTCPEGQTLERRKLNADKTAEVYQADASACNACPNKARCCPNTENGRSASRTLDEYQETLEAVSARVKSAQGQRMKKARLVVCEGAFARLKESLHWQRCRMWGKAGAEMELLWRVLANNLMLLSGAWKPLALARAAA